jgi:hypothetical protein
MIRLRSLMLPALALNMALAFSLALAAPAAADTTVCGRHYVAGGDDVPAGNEVSSDETYPSHLTTDHLATYGYCLYALAQNGTTSSSYISGGQLATTWNRAPDLITLTVGGQNSTIVNLIDSCYQKIKDNDFTGANSCALSVYANSSAWSSLTTNLTFIFQQYRVIMAGRPRMVVAVTGYPNPYPAASDATTAVPLLCVPLIDTIPTCTARWLQLPLALTSLDQAIQKLNSTIQAAVQPFAIGSGGRFVYVDAYTKLRSHCMQMDVSIKTTVEHPEESGAPHEHDSEKDFGCSSPWFVKQSDVNTDPTYLSPAAIGVLTKESQTVSGMGVHLNDDGQSCVASLIWEAPTIDGTPLKWRLGVPEAPNSDICQ